MPMRTLPYEMVQRCVKMQVGKRARQSYAASAVEVGRRNATQRLTSLIYGCAIDQMTEKYGPPSGPVRDRIESTAHRTAAGIIKSELKRGRKRRR